MGLVAVSGDSTRERLIALPPLWLLAAAIVAAVAAAMWRRPSASRLSPLLITLLIWLPFLPGPVPSAFMTWQGRIEIAIWIVTLIGLAGPLRVPGIVATPSRAPWFAAVIAMALYAGGFAALRGQLPIGDEPHYLIMTQSLLKDGDLRIENNHRNRDYAQYYRGAVLEPHYMTRGKDGEIYSVHAPGVSVLILPAFALFGYNGAAATTMAVVAAASAIGWHAAWMLTADALAAWLAWAAIFLTAPIYQQAITVFPDAVGGFGVVTAIWLLVALDAGREVRTRTLLLCGAAVATLPWLHSRFALLVAGLGIAVALRLLRQHWMRAAQFLSIPAISTCLWFGFFWWIWGSPDPRAQWGGVVAGSGPQFIWRGLTGLLLDQRAGILATAPAYFCALFGWFVLARSRRRLAIETAIVSLTLAAGVAMYDAWWGGQGAPGRYICAMLPVMIVPVAAFAASRNWWARPVMTIAIAMSLFLLISRAFLDGGAYAYTPEVGVNPVVERLTPSVDFTQAIPEVGHAEGAHYEASSAYRAWRRATVWGIAAALVAGLIRFARRFTGDGFYESHTVVASGFALLVMTAGSLTWAIHDDSGLVPASSQLHFIEAFEPALLHVSGTARLRLDRPDARAAFARPTSRLGDVRVFFLDDHAYPEPTGFWVQATGETTVAMHVDDPQRNLGVRLQAGPVATTARVTVNGESREFTFAARERHEIAIPPAAAGAWKITIRPGAGFRPQDYDANVKDARRLGVWVEVF